MNNTPKLIATTRKVEVIHNSHSTEVMFLCPLRKRCINF